MARKPPVRFLDRRLGLFATVGVVIFAIALGWGISALIVSHRPKKPVAAATEATAGSCTTRP